MPSLRLSCDSLPLALSSLFHTSIDRSFPSFILSVSCFLALLQVTDTIHSMRLLLREDKEITEGVFHACCSEIFRERAGWPDPAFRAFAAEHYPLSFIKTRLMKIEMPTHIRQILVLCDVQSRFLAHDQVTHWLNNVLFPVEEWTPLQSLFR